MHDVHLEDTDIKVPGGKDRLDESGDDTLPKDEEAEALELWFVAYYDD